MVAMSVSEERAEELANFIRSLQDQGKLDEQFNCLVEVRNNGDPLFLSDVIDIFVRDAQELLAKINTLLFTPMIDFAEVSKSAYVLKSCSLTIGGCRLVPACDELLEACAEIDERRCISLFERVRHEYDSLHANLIRISQMERAIPSTSIGVRGRRA